MGEKEVGRRGITKCDFSRAARIHGRRRVKNLLPCWIFSKVSRTGPADPMAAGEGNVACLVSRTPLSTGNT